MSDPQHIVVDPTHLAAAWQDTLGYPLTALDGRPARDIGSDLGRVLASVTTLAVRVADFYATRSALIRLGYAVVDHHDATIRITAA
ncbi:hypothetical protein ACIRD2_03255 [Streptomyces sp. NPDC093595]|uniref:hypothetical protein n=1 Tax=Streptomyces sp. NPDC093595 TaxID=3366045 RepID=UPI003829C345